MFFALETWSESHAMFSLCLHLSESFMTLGSILSEGRVPAPIIWDPIHVAQKNKNEEKIKYSFHFCNRHLQRTCLLPSRPCGSFSFHSSRPIGSAPKTLDEIAKRFEIARFREWPSFLPLGAPYPMGPEPSARPPSPARLRRGKHLLRSVDESEKKKSTFLPLDHW